MRKFLDALFQAALWMAALCLVAIALMVGLQLAGRIVDGLLKLAGLPAIGIVVLSLAEIAGYLLAAASFLALAGTLKSGAHIRVTWQLALFAFVSWQFHEVSHGVIRVPLAWPQAVMAIGALVFTVALIDEFFIVLKQGRPTFRTTEDAITLGKEG
jgi:TRAP-type C4-dicarboxylate transport system permease small subunit